MKARNQAFWIITAVVALAGTYVVWAALRAHGDLVTLNVRNMEVKKVIGKLEWQTRETILADKNVKGNVTLNVRKVPLEEVLRIVGEQTSSRLSTLYPLYSSSKAMSQLQRALRGEVDPGIAGWTNLQGRGFGGGPFGGPGGPGGFGGRGGALFGDRTNRSSVVSMDIQGKDVQFAATALSRFAGARVVPDDKLHTTVTLHLDQVPVKDAVAHLARKAKAKWDKLYVLRGDDGPR